MYMCISEYAHSSSSSPSYNNNNNNNNNSNCYSDSNYSPGLELVLGVVTSFDKGLAREIIDACDLGRVEKDIVTSSTGSVDQSSGDSLDENLVCDLEINDLVDTYALLGEQAVEYLRLIGGSGEAVEDEATLAVVALDRLSHDAGNKFIAYQLAY